MTDTHPVNPRALAAAIPDQAHRPVQEEATLLVALLPIAEVQVVHPEVLEATREAAEAALVPAEA